MIDSYNMIIAGFMGVKVYPKKGTTEFKKWKGEKCSYEVYQLQYHNDWGWLMPVIEKIEQIPDETGLAKYGVSISRDSARIFDVRGVLMEVKDKTKISAAYQLVVKFLTEQNKIGK